MRILGIETSCDETAAAVVDSNGNILSNLVLSQIKEHKAFGGVVPEIAARAHIENLHTLIKAAMDDASTKFEDLDAVAATCGPGLIGGVLVGALAGKTIALAHNIPFMAINHLEGHALTPRLTDKIEFPYLLLLISGGHTQILVCEDVGLYKCWGTTLDDAAGECFDKSAKLMGLAFPGGPNLEKIALECQNPAAATERFPLPRPMLGRKELDFSFSGLKTAVRQHVEAIQNLTRANIADLAYAFQLAVAEVFADRLTRALAKFKETYNVDKPSIVLSGGVAANRFIANKLETAFTDQNIMLYTPPLNLCGDNAAMIAWAGLERLNKGFEDGQNIKPRPRWPLDPATETKTGAGIKA